jgi:hypothetical protein
MAMRKGKLVSLLNEEGQFNAFLNPSLLKRGGLRDAPRCEKATASMGFEERGPKIRKAF